MWIDNLGIELENMVIVSTPSWVKNVNCPKGNKHDLYTLVDNEELCGERCKKCSKDVTFYKREGRINDEQWYAFHLKDFAQPGSRMFDETYGADGRKRSKETAKMYSNKWSKDRIDQEWEDTMKDAKRDMRRMDNFGRIKYL